MQNISQLNPVVQEKTSAPDILVISRVFLPKEGGIEEYAYNRCLQDPEKVIVLTGSYPGDKSFDKAQKFPVHRWFSLGAMKGGLVVSILKQIVNMIGSFVMAIKLYFCYRYRYIEWLHGYDFPSILLLSYLLPIRYFFYVHGDEAICPLHNPLLHWLFQLTLQRAETVVANSQFTQDLLKEKFDFDTPTQIIHPVVRPEKFGVALTPENLDNLGRYIREKHNIPESATVILSVARLVKRKGIDRVIENLTLLLAQGLDVHYIVCGRGAMESELKSLTRRLNLQDRVHFAGYVPDNELAGYYAACDIFAMLTFYDSKAGSIEGFGIVYAEAGYFGKPVIATPIGGVVDAVHHQENGLLVNPNFGYDTFQAFSSLCQDGELRQRLGAKGKELARRQTMHRILYSS